MFERSDCLIVVVLLLSDIALCYGVKIHLTPRCVPAPMCIHILFVYSQVEGHTNQPSTSANKHNFIVVCDSTSGRCSSGCSSGCSSSAAALLVATPGLLSVSSV